MIKEIFVYGVSCTAKKLYEPFPSKKAERIGIKAFNLLGVYQCRKCGNWISKDWEISYSTGLDFLNDDCPWPLGSYSCDNGCKRIFFPPSLKKEIHRKEWDWEQRNGGDLCQGIEPREDLDFYRNDFEVVSP